MRGGHASQQWFTQGKALLVRRAGNSSRQDQSASDLVAVGFLGTMDGVGLMPPVC